MEWDKKYLFHIIFSNWKCVLQAKMMTKTKWDIEMIIEGGQICVIFVFCINICVILIRYYYNRVFFTKRYEKRVDAFYKISGNKLWVTYAILGSHQNGSNTLKLIKKIIK